MKHIILILLFCSSLFAQKAKSVIYWENVYNNLSVQQKSKLVQIFIKGLDFNLSYSLSAIAIKESQVDKYKIAINSKHSIDVGTFMINTYWYLKRENRTVNLWNTSRAIEELSDFELNFLEAVKVLRYAYKRANQDWLKTYQYYNGSGNEAKVYAEDIINIIIVLKKHFKDVKTIRR